MKCSKNADNHYLIKLKVDFLRKISLIFTKTKHNLKQTACSKNNNLPHYFLSFRYSNFVDQNATKHSRNARIHVKQNGQKHIVKPLAKN